MEHTVIVRLFSSLRRLRSCLFTTSCDITFFSFKFLQMPTGHKVGAPALHTLTHILPSMFRDNLDLSPHPARNAHQVSYESGYTMTTRLWSSLNFALCPQPLRMNDFYSRLTKTGSVLCVNYWAVWKRKTHKSSGSLNGWNKKRGMIFFILEPVLSKNTIKCGSRDVMPINTKTNYFPLWKLTLNCLTIPK